MTSERPGDAIDVALCQYEFADVGSVDALLDRAGDLLADGGPTDLYVLPELFAADVGAAMDAEVGEPVLDGADAATVDDWVGRTAAERDAVVVGGSYNVREEGSVFNRCPVGLPDGSVERYDKRHLIPEERAGGKRAGEGKPPVVEHRGVGIGVAICYDVEFPSTIRGLADRGAEVIAVPSWTASEAGFQRVRRCAAARAVENQAYVVQVPLVGTNAGGDFGGTGRSAVFAPCDDVVGPHGTRLTLPRDEHAAGRCGLDVGALRESRERAAVRPYADATRSG